MKYSKAAMRAHHMHHAQATLLSQSSASCVEPQEDYSKPRTYSTERGPKTGNGIIIPLAFVERLHGTKKAEASVHSTGFLASGWGFL